MSRSKKTFGDIPIDHLASQPEPTNISDEFLFRNAIPEILQNAGTISGTLQAAGSGNDEGIEDQRTENQETEPEDEGKEAIAKSYFYEKYNEDDQYELAFDRLAVLHTLMKIYLRPEDENRAFVARLGFDENILMKYLVGIFGSFDNPDLSNNVVVKAKLREKENDDLDKKNRKKFSEILFYDVLQLNDVSQLNDEEIKKLVTQKCNRLTKLISNLTQLCDLPDMEKLLEVARKITSDEGESGKWLNKRDLIASAVGVGGFVNPIANHSQELSQDLALLDKWIAENIRRHSDQPSAPTVGNQPVAQAVQPQAIPQAPARIATPVQLATPAQQPQINIQSAVILLTQNTRKSVRVIDRTELMNGIEKLKDILVKFKTLGSRECAGLRTRINQTAISQGNCLGIPFFINASDDPVQLLKDHFEPESEAELEDLILEVIRQFTDSKII